MISESGLHVKSCFPLKCTYLPISDWTSNQLTGNSSIDESTCCNRVRVDQMCHPTNSWMIDLFYFNTSYFLQFFQRTFIIIWYYSQKILFFLWWFFLYRLVMVFLQKKNIFEKVSDGAHPSNNIGNKPWWCNQWGENKFQLNFSQSPQGEWKIIIELICLIEKKRFPRIRNLCWYSCF